MHLPDLITVDRIACGAVAADKMRALEIASTLIAGGRNGSGLGATEVFSSLLARERLGSTGLGHGVALPHGRSKKEHRTIGAFVHLLHGVDFDAIDHEPVDLLFAMLVPEQSTDEHLQALALLAGMFSDSAMCRQLRAASNAETVCQLIERWHSGT